MGHARLHRDRRGAAALEFALTFPVVLLFIFGLLAAFSLIVSRRAIDYGIEKALRAGVVNSGGGTSAVSTAFTNAATAIWADVGAHGTVSVTTTAASNAMVVGTALTVSVTYVWGAPGGTGNGPIASNIFNGFTMTGSGTMQVVH